MLAFFAFEIKEKISFSLISRLVKGDLANDVEAEQKMVSVDLVSSIGS